MASADLVQASQISELSFQMCLDGSLISVRRGTAQVCQIMIETMPNKASRIKLRVKRVRVFYDYMHLNYQGSQKAELVKYGDRTFSQLSLESKNFSEITQTSVAAQAATKINQ